MSLDIGNLAGEAFTIAAKENKWSFARRPFPPKFESSQDTTNAEKRKIFLRSIVRISEPGDPIEFCGGVAGYFDSVQVQALCFTDYIAGNSIENFHTMVSSFVCLWKCKGEEVVADVAFLYACEIDEITCAQGVLYGVTANTVRVGAAVVLDRCKINKLLLLEPAFSAYPISSRKKFLGKELEIDVHYNGSNFGCPIAQFVDTQVPNDISHEITIRHKEKRTDEEYVEAKVSFAFLLANFSRHGLGSISDRGSVWHFDLIEGVDLIWPECLLCCLPLPEKVVGHLGEFGVHGFCITCIDGCRDDLIAQNTAPITRYMECFVGGELHLSAPLVLIDRSTRLRSLQELNWAERMGLTELLASAQSLSRDLQAPLPAFTGHDATCL